MTKSKQILIVAFIIILSVLLIGFVSARKTEITYPTIPGAITPTQTTNFLPDYIKYIFTFAIVISAIVAFGSFVYGGIRWLISAGSSSALSDAKDRMKAGAIGLVVILSSWVILNTINPQLVTISPTAPVRWGIALYTDSVCTQNKKEITRNTDLVDPATNQPIPNGLRYLKFNDDVPKYSLEVKINNNDAMILKNEVDPHPCQDIGEAARTIEFIWKLPGVYLVKNDAQSTEKFLPASTATLGDFENSIRQIKFVDILGVDLNFGAVLHEDQYWKGTCQVFHGYKNFITWYNPDIGGRTSSVTTFVRADDPGPGGVTIFENDNFGGESWPLLVNQYRPPTYVEEDLNRCNDLSSDQRRRATSIRISGRYLAVLFEGSDCQGKCQVFTNSDSNLRDDEIGRCGCGLFGWGCGDCLTSYKVIPTK